MCVMLSSTCAHAQFLISHKSMHTIDKTTWHTPTTQPKGHLNVSSRHQLVGLEPPVAHTSGFGQVLRTGFHFYPADTKLHEGI